MSERQYFSLRYAIPGFALILVFIAINYVPLLKIMKEVTEVSEVFGASLAFLALFSGSALGFLISQAWWWWFQCKVGIWGIGKFKKAITAFFERYGLEKPCNTDEKRKFLSVLDYVSHSCSDEKVLALAERRWDMYHILSSTYLTLGIGVVTAILCRFYYEWTVFNCSFLILNISSPFHAKAWTELVAVVGLLAGIAFLLFFLHRGRQWITISMSSLYEARIRTSNVKKDDLEKAFPDIFKKHQKKEPEQLTQDDSGLS